MFMHKKIRNAASLGEKRETGWQAVKTLVLN